jgi:hypothetical protein
MLVPVTGTTPDMDAWRGPAQFAGAALIVTIVALWATRPPPTCDMTVEPHSHLDLDRVVDREHLAADIGASGRIARRYLTGMPEHPAGAHDAPVQAPETDDERCHQRLTQQIMTTHDLTLAQILAAARRAPG